MWFMSAHHPAHHACGLEKLRVHPCLEELETRDVPSTTTQPFTIPNATAVPASESASAMPEPSPQPATSTSDTAFTQTNPGNSLRTGNAPTSDQAAMFNQTNQANGNLNNNGTQGQPGNLSTMTTNQMTPTLLAEQMTQQEQLARAGFGNGTGNNLVNSGLSPAQPLTTVGAPLAPFAVSFSPTSPVGANGAPTTPQTPQAEVPASALTVSLGSVANPALLVESPVLAQMHESTQITGGAAEDFAAGGASPGGRPAEQPRLRRAAKDQRATPAANATPANPNAARPASFFRVTTPATPNRGSFLPNFELQRQPEAPRPDGQPAAPRLQQEPENPDEQSRANPAPRERNRPLDTAAAVAAMAPGLALVWEERRRNERRHARKSRA